MLLKRERERERARARAGKKNKRQSKGDPISQHRREKSKRNPKMSLRASSPHARSMFSVRTADSSIYDEEIKSGRAWAKQMSDPWDPLILTLDGGGIRGYSSLLILERLMREVAVWENRFEEQEADLDVPDRTFDEKTLLPCHYFDYMYGTSTGG